MSIRNITSEHTSSDCCSVNRHVQASIMLLSIMDGAELDLNNKVLSSTSKTTNPSTTSSIASSDDYDKDLQLAAELGRCLLEQNQELQNYIGALQKQIEEEQCDIKLLHAKLESTREQLETKCKQTEILDATNIDLERELTQQRRDNERDRLRIKELTDLCEKTRKQCFEIEHEYETFRLKQFQTHFFPKSLNSSLPIQRISTSKSSKLRRSNSFTLNSTINSSSSNLLVNTNMFDISSASIFKNHLAEMKLRINDLTSECAKLSENYHRSEQEKRYLIERIANLERQNRDDNDSLQTELNHYKKLFEKYTNDNSNKVLLDIYSPPEHDVSLYDEVLLENKQTLSKTLYEPTNYKDLFARVYDKLKISNNNNNDL